jgi:hypothetical protein
VRRAPGSHRRLIFASLTEDGPSLDEHLAPVIKHVAACVKEIRKCRADGCTRGFTNGHGLLERPGGAQPGEQLDRGA